MTEYRKKLIEVALPLEEINVASAREKSIRHGHPSTLHLWRARRPLATCRAVLFTSIIDDPGEEGVPQDLLSRIDSLPLGSKYRHLVEEEILDKAGKPLEPQEERRLKTARERRYRLFTFIEQLVQWENSNDADTLKTARELIHAATGGNPPPVLDPFCGGGSIPLEAQRLGLEAHASDLNPVAVLITKAMIEIPPKFAGLPPINPEARYKIGHTGTWKGATGLAEDVRYYGKWMRDEAEKRVGHLYPKVRVTEEIAQNRPDLEPLVGEEVTVIAWLWARTIPSPDPAARGAHVPLVRSFVLSSKKGKEAWIEPVVDTEDLSYRFEVRVSSREPHAGTVGREGARCILTGSPIRLEYIREQARSGNMRQRLTAIVAHGPHGRIYLPPNSYHESTAASATPTDAPIGDLPEKALGFRVQAYGMKRFADLYNNRQTVTLTALCGLVVSVCALVHEHGVDAGLIEKDAASRASAIATYLSFVLSKLADLSNALNRWEPVAQCPRNLFTRQAVPMVWDTAEGNPLGTSSGSWLRCLSNEISGLTSAPMQMITPMPGHASQCDARELKELLVKPIVSTDPPYYDNVPYADLSDFFYVWLRRSLGVSYPDLFSTILVPKAEELVSDPFRHGGKDEARKFFEEGTRTTFGRIRDISSESFPVSIYYAFSISPITPGNVACLAEISDRLTLCIR